jgi:hypothetical protein
VSHERGDEIQRRLDAIGISDRRFQELSVSDLHPRGIDRKTLRRAIDEDTARPSTYRAIEDALDAIEARIGGKPTTAPQETSPGEGLVEFTIEGNFGVRAVVKGPVKDMDALQAAVAELVREMRRDSEDGN